MYWFKTKYYLFIYLEINKYKKENGADSDGFADAIDPELPRGVDSVSDIMLLKSDKHLNIPVTQEEELYTVYILIFIEWYYSRTTKNVRITWW